MESKSTPKVKNTDSKAKQEISELFKDVDENMELDKEQQKELNEFETINKDGKCKNLV